jgi:hypothetical protein
MTAMLLMNAGVNGITEDDFNDRFFNPDGAWDEIYLFL